MGQVQVCITWVPLSPGHRESPSSEVSQRSANTSCPKPNVEAAQLHAKQTGRESEYLLKNNPNYQQTEAVSSVVVTFISEFMSCLC